MQKIGKSAVSSSYSTGQRVCCVDDSGSKRSGSSIPTGVAGNEGGKASSDPPISSGFAAKVGKFERAARSVNVAMPACHWRLRGAVDHPPVLEALQGRWFDAGSAAVYVVHGFKVTRFNSGRRPATFQMHWSHDQEVLLWGQGKYVLRSELRVGCSFLMEAVWGRIDGRQKGFRWRRESRSPSTSATEMCLCCVQRPGRQARSPSPPLPPVPQLPGAFVEACAAQQATSRRFFESEQSVRDAWGAEAHAGLAGHMEQSTVNGHMQLANGSIFLTAWELLDDSDGDSVFCGPPSESGEGGHSELAAIEALGIGLAVSDQEHDTVPKVETVAEDLAALLD